MEKKAKMVIENKGRKYHCKKVRITKKRPFFPLRRVGWGGDRCHQVHVLMCTGDTVAMESYAPGLFYLVKYMQNQVI